MNKKIDEYLNDKLENEYHMNDRLVKVKDSLSFKNESKQSKYNTKLNLIFIVSSLIVCILMSASTFLITRYYYKDISHSNIIYMEDYNEKAVEYISKQCESYYSIPLVTYNLEQDFFLSIYEGTIEQKKVYFYQFGSYISSKYLVDIEFYNERNQYLKINDIKDLDIGIISSDEFITEGKVYFNYYRNNELKLNLQII